MGNSQLRTNNEEPNLNEWQVKEKHNNMTIWKNRADHKVQIEQYPLYLNDQKQFDKEKSLYLLRKDHLSLVASKYFKEEKTQQFCSSTYKGDLFIERIPIRLSNVTDIPFPDVLHLFSQVLNGFKLLSARVGFFFITEDNIGINKDGKAKVWLNKDFQKSYPSEQHCSEQAMVRNIIQIIEHNTDQDSIRNRSIFNYIYSNTTSLNFQQALTRLNQYVNEFYNGQIPPKLNCVMKAGGTEALINQYRANNQKIVESNHNSSIDRNTPFFQQPAHNYEPLKISNSQHNKVHFQRKNTIVEKMNEPDKLLTRSQGTNNNYYHKEAIVPLVQLTPNAQPHINASYYNNTQQITNQQQINTQQPNHNNLIFTLNPVHTQPPITYQTTPPTIYSHFQSYKQSEAQSGLPSKASQLQMIPNQIQINTQNNLRSSLNVSQKNTVIEKIKNNPLVIDNSSASIHQDKPPSVIIRKQPTKTIPPQELAKGIPIQRSDKKTFQQPTKIEHKIQINKEVLQSKTYQNNTDNQPPKVQFVSPLQQITHQRTAQSQTLQQNEKQQIRHNIMYIQNNQQRLSNNTNKQQLSEFSKIKNDQPITKQVNYKINNDSVPEISEISSIGKNKINKNILSQNRFSEIRGQSINDSTVNFYNSFVNKEEEESNAQWQDYTQAQSQFIKAKSPNVYYHNYNQQKYDGTSQQFLNQLKNTHEANSVSGSPQKIDNFHFMSYQTKPYQSIPNYQPTYTTQSYTRPSQIKYQSKYNYQSKPSEKNVTPIGTFKEVQLAAYNNERKEEYEYKYYSDSSNQINNHKATIFYSDSFGINNPRATTLEENLQMKYSMTQDEQYHVDWDPEILADLKSLHH